MTAWVGLAAVVAAGLVPWVLVIGDGAGTSVTLVFAFGLVNPDPFHVTSLPAYLTTLTRGIPRSLLAWPVATLLWIGALGSALAGASVDREDRRVTGGLLTLAGLSLIPVAMAVGRPAAVTAVPVGTLALLAVAWWGFGDALRRIVSEEPAGER